MACSHFTPRFDMASWIPGGPRTSSCSADFRPAKIAINHQFLFSHQKINANHATPKARTHPTRHTPQTIICRPPRGGGLQVELHLELDRIRGGIHRGPGTALPGPGAAHSQVPSLEGMLVLHASRSLLLSLLLSSLVSLLKLLLAFYVARLFRRNLAGGQQA